MEFLKEQLINAGVGTVGATCAFLLWGLLRKWL